MIQIQDNIVPVFVAYEVHDEFGHRKSLIGVYRNKQDAEFATIRRGWYGGPGDVQMKHAIEDGLDLYILEGFKGPQCFADVTAQREEERKAKVARIMAKLTAEKLELLKGEL